MNQTRMLALLAGVAMGAGAAVAQTTDASLERELLADAGARASLQAGGTAGHDGSFFLSDSSGNNRLEVGGYTQFRYTFNNRDSVSPDEDLTNGFSLNRTALEFGGNVINENVGYYIRGYFDTSDSNGDGSGNFSLADAYGTYTFENNVTLMWGQFLAPLTRERIVDDRHQLAADRSIAGGQFSAEYTQGIAASMSNDNFRGVVSLNDGALNGNTSYYSSAEADFGVTGRVEFKWQGDWAQFDDFTSFRGTEGYAGMIGGAVHWEGHGDTANVTSFGGTAPADFDFFAYTVDASVEGDGWNVFGAFMGSSFDPAGGSSNDNLGAVVQGGFFFTEQFEAFARWDSIFFDDTGLSSAADDNYNTITFGGNYYFVAGSHAAKFTGDVQWSFDNQGGWANANPARLGGPSDHTTGLLPDPDDSQWQIRLQMQLVF